MIVHEGESDTTQHYCRHYHLVIREFGGKPCPVEAKSSFYRTSQQGGHLAQVATLFLLGLRSTRLSANDFSPMGYCF